MYLRHLHEHLCDTRAANAQQGRRVVQQQGRRPEGKRQDTHQRAMVSEHTGGTGSTMRIVVIDEMVRKYTKASHLRQMHYGECQTRSHTHTHTHACVCVCTHAHIYVYTRTCMHLRIHLHCKYTHTHIRTHTHIYTHTRVYTYKHMYAPANARCAVEEGCVLVNACLHDLLAHLLQHRRQHLPQVCGLWFVV